MHTIRLHLCKLPTSRPPPPPPSNSSRMKEACSRKQAITAHWISILPNWSPHQKYSFTIQRCVQTRAAFLPSDKPTRILQILVFPLSILQILPGTAQRWSKCRTKVQERRAEVGSTPGESTGRRRHHVGFELAMRGTSSTLCPPKAWFCCWETPGPSR